MASLFPVKIVLLEYSARDQQVWVRAVFREEDRPKHVYAPIHEGNRQSYVRVYEGRDNMANAVGFSRLVASGEEGERH